MTDMEKEKFKVVATKVSTFVKERIGRICRKKQMNEYEMLQMMCDCIVRYMDDRHNLTPELERIISIFEHLEGWRNAFNLADHTAEPEICEAFYVLKAKGKTGFRVVHVERPWWDGMESWKQTENIQMLLERFLEVMLPEKYRRLRMLSAEKGIESQLDLLDYLIDSHMEDAVNAHYRSEFEDAARAENGRPVIFGQRTKRVHHHSPDEYIEQGVIQFGKGDTPTGVDGIPDASEEARDWLEENSDFRPYGMDW